MVPQVALVTASFGGLDPVLPLPRRKRVRAATYCYTDQPGVKASGWDVIATQHPALNPRLAAKYYKCQIHRLRAVQGHKWLAWVDACLQLNDLEFLATWANLAGRERAVLVPHPDRKTVAEEYDYILGHLARGSSPYLSARYDEGTLIAERNHFSREADLGHCPLWAGGVWLLPNVPRVHMFLDDWWRTVNTFSIFDQAAITPLLERHRIEVAPYDVNLFKNEHWARVPHA